MYRAIVSFSGLISMSKGEVREISDLAIAQDLLKAGYIEEVKEEVKKTKPRKKRGVKS